MWKDNDKIIEVFNSIGHNKTVFPCACPICKEKTAHVYIHKHNDKHCGIWTWCSNCGATSHMSGETPEWWKNPDFIDPSHLCAEPDYLEQLKDKIDGWLNSFADKGATTIKKPFVMKSQFDVILKEELQGIPAGTPGTIIIKDDFKTTVIDFIGSDGKKINIHESPEKLARVIEVVEPSKSNQPPKM